MFKRSPRGFTLIELLVVIAIIGILSSVVLASLNDARKKSRDAKRIADVKQLQLALELFFDSNNTYPTTTLSALTTGGYIAQLPKDPTTNADYSYASLGTSGTSCTSYHLGATLEQTGHQALQNDLDGTAGTACTNGTWTDFAGTDPIYDVKP